MLSMVEKPRHTDDELSNAGVYLFGVPSPGYFRTCRSGLWSESCFHVS